MTTSRNSKLLFQRAATPPPVRPMPDEDRVLVPEEEKSPAPRRFKQRTSVSADGTASRSSTEPGVTHNPKEPGDFLFEKYMHASSMPLHNQDAMLRTALSQGSSLPDLPDHEFVPNGFPSEGLLLEPSRTILRSASADTKKMNRKASPEIADLNKQISVMQEQLSSMMEGQERVQATVVKVHADVSELLSRSGGNEGTVSNSPVSPAFAKTVSIPSNDSTPGRRMSHRGSTTTRRALSLLPYQKKLRQDQTSNTVDLARRQKPEQTPEGVSATSPGSPRGFHQQLACVDDELVANAEEVSKHAARSKNSFADKAATEYDDMEMLHELFSAAETANEQAEQMAVMKHHRISYYRYVLSTLDSQNLELVVDSLIGFVIIMNAIFIGLSMDHSDESPVVWNAIDYCFSVIFLLEIGFKIWLNGFCHHFGGPSRYSNSFDASLIFIDLLQLLIVTVGQEITGGGLSATPPASLFRIVRLGKLARMLRLLESSVFNDLLAMLQGMLGGMATLGWSMVLFVVAIYVVALLFREFFGKGDVPEVSELFNSVPRSMFTTFRCSFGDCSSPSGMPIFEFVNKEYGGFSSFAYCLFMFVITIGLFNVISAIFVESTMAAASSLQMQKKKGRLQDTRLWCTSVAKLVKRLMVISGEKKITNDWKLTESLDFVYRLEVPCAMIDELAQDQEAIAALSALDIAPEDRDYLSDILDPDNGGTINVIELVEGLRRLRGDPRRSDIVTVNLMVRSIQRDVADIFAALEGIRSRLATKDTL